MTVLSCACGASNPRDIKVPGRDAKGIYFAVDFLTGYHEESFGFQFEGRQCMSTSKNKKVMVIGGGDTGNDCCGTAIRLGAQSCDTAGNDAEGYRITVQPIIRGRSGQRSARQIMVRRRQLPSGDMIRESILRQSRSLSRMRRVSSVRQSW